MVYLNILGIFAIRGGVGRGGVNIRARGLHAQDLVDSSGPALARALMTEL